MQFNDVIGQNPVKAQLRHQVQQNRISHAQLFLAKEGTGGLSMAMAFAQYIMCDRVNGKPEKASSPTDLFAAAPAEIENESEKALPADSCGICPSCQKAAALIHPDIHFSYPIFVRKSGDKPVCTNFITEWRSFISQQPHGNMYDWLQHAGAENKQGNINVHECTDILRKLSLKSFEAGYKILIMWMPEALGKEGNKLLKLIEEPPDNTLFLFVAENDALLLPTILSRTQLLKFPPLQPDYIKNALEQRAQIADEQAENISLLADGNFREALHLLQHADDNWEEVMRNWLNTILKTGQMAQLAWIDDMAKQGREKQKQFLKYATHLMEQATRLKISGMEEGANPSGIVAFAARLNNMISIDQIEAIGKELDSATYYVERNANPKLLFHALTIKFYHIIKNNSVISIQ